MEGGGTIKEIQKIAVKNISDLFLVRIISKKKNVALFSLNENNAYEKS